MKNFMETGIVGLPAPPLAHVRWIDENGDARDPLALAELGPGYAILYFFQNWCAGCHAHGFPAFVTLAEKLRDTGVSFAAIQTVFEGSDVNTFDRLRENQRRYGLHVPFGHAAADSTSADAVPAVMDAYRSGGTPWFVVIAPDGRVVYDGFRLDVDGLVRALRRRSRRSRRRSQSEPADRSAKSKIDPAARLQNARQGFPSREIDRLLRDNNEDQRARIAAPTVLKASSARSELAFRHCPPPTSSIQE
jgi:hypothetical protein